jgi:hypothetical protein
LELSPGKDEEIFMLTSWPLHTNLVNSLHGQTVDSSMFHEGGSIMKRFITAGFLGATALVLTSFGMAMSHDGKEKAALANLPTSVTMEEAIKIATTQFPGKVLEAELESEDGKAVYEVEIVNTSGETRELEIDAQSGKILSSELEDQDEHEKETSDKDWEKS